MCITETEADAEEMLRDLELLKKQFEFIGSYPELLQQAELWDGKAEVDPIGYYLENARKARIEAQLEGEMTAEEYLEEQARKAAAESVPSLFSMEMYKARTGSEKFAPDARGKEPVLSVNVHAVLADGSKATKNDLIADEDGSVFWGRLPELEALKDKGYAGLNLLLRLGYKNEGFNHIVNLHGQWIMDAMGIDDPIIACKRFISTVLNSVKKINYITNGARDSVIVKSGETERYFIVAVGKDRVDSKYAAIKTAFVASSAGRYDSDITIYGGKDALELRIPMSSFGENQRFRATSERQDRNSDYPDTAAASPSEDIMPQVGRVVKHEELISYKNDNRVSFSVIGPKAATWDKYADRAFKGRDDGMLRAEIDASGAKIKGFPNTYPVQEVMRKLIHDGVYDREENMVYSSLSFVEDITQEERGETKLSETELKEDCDKYPDLAEEEP